MDAVLDGLDGAVPDGLLMMPTYTYSFTKNEPFDVDGTPSTVGMLTEYFRRRPGVRRTAEPIFSSAVRGALPPAWEHLFEARDVTCFGEDSIFACLYELDAKLVLFGVSFEFCTYVYLVEQRLEVPYRYLKDFSGEIVLDGTTTPAVARYYVRKLDEDVENTFTPLSTELLARGEAQVVEIPRGPRIVIAGARAIHDVATEQVRRNPDYLLKRGHPAEAAS